MLPMRRKTKRVCRILSAVLALCLMVPCQAIAKTIDEVQAEQEKLRQENEELQTKIDSLRADEAKALEYQEALEEKIELTEQKIDTSRESIELMDTEIEALEKKLNASKKEYEDTIRLFSERIKALYKTGTVGTLEILLSADSFTDFTMKTELISRVTEHDQELLDKIEDYLERTQQDREDLQKMREDEAKIKQELESAQKELVALHEENDAAIAALETKQAEAREVIEQNEQEDAALEEELQELIRQRNEEEKKRQEQIANGGSVPPVNPGMHGDFTPCWPLPGVGVGSITGHYGEMYFNGPHNGLDIGAPYGEPIVAAQAGQVLSAEYHWSWGNNVLLWHNDTFATRYAHMSRIAVSAGQYVEQGDIIGYVGATGQAFGDHLHFEVYYNGSRVDPDPYLGI